MYREKCVGIIVPVYNVNIELVKKCLNSIINQSYKNIEIVIVDDGNSSDYVEVLHTLVQVDSRIKICSHDKNKGLYQARLTGVENTKAEYVAFVDADDYIGVDWIRLLVDKAERTNADITMGRTINEDDNHWKYIYNSNYSICNQNCKKNEEVFEYFIKDCGLDFSIHTVWNKLYTRSLWEKARKELYRVNEHLVMTEDILFTAILFFFANKMAFSNHDGYFYYRNSQSSTVGKMTVEKCNKNIMDLILVFNTLKSFMEDYSIYSKYETYYKEWKNRYYRWWSYTVQSVCEENPGKEAVKLRDRFFHAFEKNSYEDTDVSDGYFDQKKTEWDSSLENIKMAICQADIKVISFDLFDTLIVRPVLNPEDVYFVVTNEIDLLNYSKESITRFRTLAEEYARKNIVAENPYYEDVTITEIYDVMNQIFGVPKNLCDKLKQKEEDVEVEFANVRRVGWTLYTLAIAMGKKVYVTTDMYLERKTIDTILEKNGYTNLSGVILSSETRTLKTTGKSFSALLEVAKCKGNQALHIGDNWNVDFIMAKQKGLLSYFLPKTKDILLNYLGDKYTGNSFGEALNNEGSIIDFSNYFKSFATRCICAISANMLFDDPYVSFNKESDYNGNPYHFGVAALGAHMYGVCSWLMELAEEIGAKTVHFAARDGYYIKAAFDCLNDTLKKNLKTNYLYISRKAFIPLEIKERNDVNKIYDSCSLYANSPLSIIERYKKVLRPITENDIKFYKKHGIDIHERFKNEEQFVYFLNLLGENQFSLEVAKKEYENCEKYLSDAGISDKDIVFDLGYSGKLHMDLVECCKKNIVGAYISKDGYNSLLRIQQNHLDIRSYYDFLPSMQGIINEFIFSDRNPSCIGYMNTDSGVSVEFEEKMEDYIGDYVVNEINRGSFDFIKMFAETFKNHIDLMKFMPLDSSLLYEKFLIEPKPFDKAIFDYCLIEDEYYGGIRERKLTELWEWQLENRRLKRQIREKTVEKPAENIVYEDPKYIEWKVYDNNVIKKSIIKKALYWFCVDHKFFKERIKARINN